MALGPRVKSKTAVRRVPLNLKVPPALRKSMEKAADRSGRSLGAEVEFRAQEYETLRGFVDRLLGDSAAINIAVDLETLRKRARTSPASSISDEETAPLERAVVTAACIAKLFQTVAEHAGHKLAEKRAEKMTDGWTQRIESGDLAADFDIPATAERFSTGLTDIAIQEGERMARHMEAAIGPNIWDVCFNKDDPLRSTSIGTGRGLMGHMGTLLTSGVGLPPSFMPPPQTEDERQAIFEQMKESGTIRDTAKHQINEGQHPGMSEDEVVDMLFGKLMTFDTELSEATPNAKAS